MFHLYFSRVIVSEDSEMDICVWECLGLEEKKKQKDVKTNMPLGDFFNNLQIEPIPVKDTVVPSNVPENNLFGLNRGESFFVRPCYPVIYDEMVIFFNQSFKSSENCCGYMVKGGPGIGKSVFVRYFVHRFISEYKKNEDLLFLYFRINFGFFCCKTFE
jgi:hypothetical protein